MQCLKKLHTCSYFLVAAHCQTLQVTYSNYYKQTISLIHMEGIWVPVHLELVGKQAIT